MAVYAMNWPVLAQRLDLSGSFVGDFAPGLFFVGVISAVIDNIPVIFAILSMHPDMSTGQWLLVTLTAGVGGSPVRSSETRRNQVAVSAGGAGASPARVISASTK